MEGVLERAIDIARVTGVPVDLYWPVGVLIQIDSCLCSEGLHVCQLTMLR